MGKPVFFPKNECCVSYSELIQRELLWLEVWFFNFFFEFCFPKIVKLYFLRNPNPNPNPDPNPTPSHFWRRRTVWLRPSRSQFVMSKTEQKTWF